MVVGLDAVIRTTEWPDSESTTNTRMVKSKVRKTDCISCLVVYIDIIEVSFTKISVRDL